MSGYGLAFLFGHETTLTRGEIMEALKNTRVPAAVTAGLAGIAMAGELPAQAQYDQGMTDNFKKSAFCTKAFAELPLEGTPGTDNYLRVSAPILKGTKPTRERLVSFGFDPQSQSKLRQAYPDCDMTIDRTTTGQITYDGKPVRYTYKDKQGARHSYNAGDFPTLVTPRKDNGDKVRRLLRTNSFTCGKILVEKLTTKAVDPATRVQSTRDKIVSVRIPC
jgi:hypothetical protein